MIRSRKRSKKNRGEKHLKNLVITGSSRGLGFEMARKFLELGCNVTISGSSLSNLDKAWLSLKDYQDRILAVQCDVRKRDQLFNLWQKSQDRWGKIDIWINNAGISQQNNTLWGLSADDTDNVVQTNLMGTIYGSQVAMQGMLKQEEGRIYNMEGFGSNDMMRRGLNLYGTSKRALTYFTRALAQEAEGNNIKVGALSPGMMVTEFITGPTVGKKKEINEETRRIFNILGDRPETVARFLVDEMMKDKNNGSHIVWLTRRKVMFRFFKAIFIKRNLFDQITYDD